MLDTLKHSTLDTYVPCPCKHYSDISFSMQKQIICKLCYHQWIDVFGYGAQYEHYDLPKVVNFWVTVGQNFLQWPIYLRSRKFHEGFKTSGISWLVHVEGWKNGSRLGVDILSTMKDLFSYSAHLQCELSFVLFHVLYFGVFEASFWSY